MRTLIVWFLLTGCLIGCVAPKPTVSIKVRTDLADMFEDVVRKAKAVDKTIKSIHISEYTDTYLIIDKINDIDVCSKDTESLVAVLQYAFEEHPSIDRNVGPHIFAFIDDNGKRSSFHTTSDQLRTVCESPGIYISVRK